MLTRDQNVIEPVPNIQIPPSLSGLVRVTTQTESTASEVIGNNTPTIKQCSVQIECLDYILSREIPPSLSGLVRVTTQTESTASEVIGNNTPTIKQCSIQIERLDYILSREIKKLNTGYNLRRRVSKPVIDICLSEGGNSYQ